jgi:hypothetical protein
MRLTRLLLLLGILLLAVPAASGPAMADQDEASIVRFIEDNWSLGRIGSGSADAVAGSLGGMFDFSRPSPQRLLLEPSTGQPRPGEDTGNGD